MNFTTRAIYDLICLDSKYEQSLREIIRPSTNNIIENISIKLKKQRMQNLIDSWIKTEINNCGHSYMKKYLKFSTINYDYLYKMFLSNNKFHV